MTATAWTTYREAEASARRAGDGHREQVARGRASALQVHLAMLTLRVSAAQRAEGLRVLRDGSVGDGPCRRERGWRRA